MLFLAFGGKIRNMILILEDKTSYSTFDSKMMTIHFIVLMRVTQRRGHEMLTIMKITIEINKLIIRVPHDFIITRMTNLEQNHFSISIA